jgi:hypothetical protein
MCLFFRQNGGEGFPQEQENLIPQVSKHHLWINREEILKGNYFLENYELMV